MMRIFADETSGAEHIVLTKGDLTAPGPVLVRMHVLDPLSDVLGLRPGKMNDLGRAMEALFRSGGLCRR